MKDRCWLKYYLCIGCGEWGKVMETHFLHFPSFSPIPRNTQNKYIIHTSSSIKHLSFTFHHFPPFSTPYKHPSSTFHHFPSFPKIHKISTLYILVVQPNIYPPLSIIFLHFPHPTNILPLLSSTFHHFPPFHNL